MDADNYFCIMKEAIEFQFCNSQDSDSVCQKKVDKIYVIAPMFRDEGHNSKENYYCWSTSNWIQGNKSLKDYWVVLDTNF